MTAAARPNYATSRVVSHNTLPYAMGYSTSAGAVEGQAFTVASIVKSSTGVYKITFAEAIAGRKFILCNFGVASNFITSTSDGTSITVAITDLAGALVDREFGFVVYSTAWW